jgi:hypothetical protein
MILILPSMKPTILQSDCKNDVDGKTQPLEPNSFVLLQFAKKQTVKYFVGLIQEMGPDGCNT